MTKLHDCVVKLDTEPDLSVSALLNKRASGPEEYSSNRLHAAAAAAAGTSGAAPMEEDAFHESESEDDGPLSRARAADSKDDAKQDSNRAHRQTVPSTKSLYDCLRLASIHRVPEYVYHREQCWSVLVVG